MEIIKKNVASIRHNNPAVKERIYLSIAKEGNRYLIVTSEDEIAASNFKKQIEAESAIYQFWGRTSDWDLRYNN